MKLINYKNQHFNLIVDEDDEIVKMLVPEGKKHHSVKVGEIGSKDGHVVKDLEERLKIAEEEKKDLAVKLKIAEESKTKLRNDHKEAMKEVGRMKETIEKYKIENKTLAEYKSMISKNVAPTPDPCQPPKLPAHELPSPKLPAPELPAADLQVHQQATSASPGDLPPHQSGVQPSSNNPAPWTLVPPSLHRKKVTRTGSGSESNQRNCPKCYFQSNCKDEMDNHYKMSHVPQGESMNIAIRTEAMICRNCKVEFKNYWSLMNHRRDNHPTEKACRYDLEDRCKHNDNECWYKHKNKNNPNMHSPNASQNQTNINECYDCKLKFRNKNELMMHKKIQHIEKCKPCDKYFKNLCTRESTCWYPHIQNQDFHENQLNSRPPINQEN